MEYTYSAFISYRHLPTDIAAAKAVQRALETYHIPGDIQKKTGVKKLNRCFRDQDELPLADDLGDSITKALQESEWLIIICSPDLPESPWCLREVDYFIELGRKDRIIPVLIDGTPKESYPPQITVADKEHGEEELEPLAADLRGDLQKQLKTEKLRIVARMLNINFNDLKRRERERALRRGLVLVCCVLAVVLGFAAYAIYKNRVLTEERNATARNATELLIEKSIRSTSEGEIGNGLAYAIQAYKGSRIFKDEYDVAVSAALEAAMYPKLYSQIGSLKDNGVLHSWANISNNGKYIACRQADESVQIYNSITGEKLYTIRNTGYIRRSGRDISPDNQYVIHCTDSTVTLYNIEDGTEAVTADLPEGWEVSLVSLTSENEVPVSQTGGGACGLFDPFTKKLTELDGVSCTGFGYSDLIQIHRSGRRGAWSDGEHIWLVDTEKREVVMTLDGALNWLSGGFTDEGCYFEYYNGEEYVYLHWDTFEEACRFDHEGSLSPDGTLLASPDGIEGFTIWDVKTGEALWSAGKNVRNNLYNVAFADNDTLIASHEQLQIYRVSDQTVVYDSGDDHTTYGYDFAAGRLVMCLRAGGCLINLMPEEEDILPHMILETRDISDEDNLIETTQRCFLTGSWDYNYFNMSPDEAESEEQGLIYEWNDNEYLIYPMNGVEFMTGIIFVSPDGKWQAVIRDQEVDIFRAEEGPEPVLTIPGNGYSRRCVAIYGDTLALGAYVENMVLYDLNTGDCLGSVDTGAMCELIQFSPDGRYIIALSAVAEQVVVVSTENLAVLMRIPVTDIYDYPNMHIGFNEEGTEAMVLYSDGHMDVGLLYEDLDTLVEKAEMYME